MQQKQHLLLALLLFLLGSYGGTSGANYTIKYEWNVLDYDYPSEKQRQDDIDSGKFIPENNAISGIKLFGDVLFLSVPRWKDGVPSTLNMMAQKSAEGLRSPKLVPYPSWEMQEVGNCAKFQYVQSMEVDRLGNLWVVDVGRVNLVTNPINKCPPKLVILNLEREEIFRRYEFPDDVAPHDSSFLVQIVIECPALDGGIVVVPTSSSNNSSENVDPSSSLDDCYAYISDAESSSLIVYHFGGNTSWRFQHPFMNADPNAMQFNILGQYFALNASVDGIALSPVGSDQTRTLYFCPLSSYNLYSVDTSALKNSSVSLEGLVQEVGSKASQSGGLTMANNGFLYYSLLGLNALYRWNISTPFVKENQECLAQSDEDLQLVDKFGFDGDGYLWFTSINVRIYFSDFSNATVNFRVINMFVDAGSYLQLMRVPRVTADNGGGSDLDTITYDDSAVINTTVDTSDTPNSTTEVPEYITTIAVDNTSDIPNTTVSEYITTIAVDNTSDIPNTTVSKYITTIAVDNTSDIPNTTVSEYITTIAVDNTSDIPNTTVSEYITTIAVDNTSDIPNTTVSEYITTINTELHNDTLAIIDKSTTRSPQPSTAEMTTTIIAELHNNTLAIINKSTTRPPHHNSAGGIYAGTLSFVVVILYRLC